MAITINRTGLEITAGPLELYLTRSLLGFVWRGRVDFLLEDAGPCVGGGGFLAQKTGSGWYEVFVLRLRLSVQVGVGWRSAVPA